MPTAEAKVQEQELNQNQDENIFRFKIIKMLRYYVCLLVGKYTNKKQGVFQKLADPGAQGGNALELISVLFKLVALLLCRCRAIRRARLLGTRTHTSGCG